MFSISYFWHPGVLSLEKLSNAGYRNREVPKMLVNLTRGEIRYTDYTLCIYLVHCSFNSRPLVLHAQGGQVPDTALPTGDLLNFTKQLDKKVLGLHFFNQVPMSCPRKIEDIPDCDIPRLVDSVNFT